MKGWRFYQQHGINGDMKVVYAVRQVWDEIQEGETFHFGIIAYFGHIRGTQSFGGLSHERLLWQTRRISESKARELTPHLFTGLGYKDGPWYQAGIADVEDDA